MRGMLFRVLLPAMLLATAAACEGATEPADPTTPTGCRVEVAPIDGGPDAQLTGTGFPPDEPATLTIVGPPDGEPLVLDQTTEPELRSDVRGVVLFGLSPRREHIGMTTFELAAGGCTASTTNSLDASLFPPACPTEPAGPSRAQTAARYRDLVLADAPVAYWQFDDLVGPVVAALAGRPGSVQGDGRFRLPGAMPGSLSLGLDGEADVVEITPIELAGDFTVEGWVFLCDNPINNRDGLFAAPEGAPNVNFFNAAPRFWTGDEDIVGTPDGALEHVRWHHIALVRRAGELELVVDGVSAGFGTYEPPLVIATLGDSGGGSTTGQLDELAIYDHALTLDDIAVRVGAATD